MLTEREIYQTEVDTARTEIGELIASLTGADATDVRVRALVDCIEALAEGKAELAIDEATNQHERTYHGREG